MDCSNCFKVVFVIRVLVELFAVGQSISLDKECRNIKYEVKLAQDKALLNHVIDNVTGESDANCRINCYLNHDCDSYNVGPSPEPGMLLCELNNADRHQYPHDYQDRPGFSYRGTLENKCAANPCENGGTCYHGYGADNYLCSCKVGFIGKHCDTEFGKSSSSPAKSCSHLKQEVPSLPSGNYWIDPDQGHASNSFLAYCDMETDGGGWTLVWAYTFILYENFNTKPNAVTPGPKTYGLEGTSDTPPNNETDYNAIDFTKWKLIGSEILVKSNINNWLACRVRTGSFVTKTDGPMDCRMIKIIADYCSVVPTYFGCYQYGCYLKVNSAISAVYYWETSTSTHWPVHDPCGKRAPNQLKNIPNPHGNIYVR